MVHPWPLLSLTLAAETDDPAFAPVVDDPALPRVLLIGDSISIGYTVPVREALRGEMNVHRVPTNGLDTRTGREHIDEWLGDGRWDVIHFNWGLHDIKIAPDNRRQVPKAEYEANLVALVERLSRTGAMLVWATTTPVPNGETFSPHRLDSDVKAYNARARAVTEAYGIMVNDLYAYALKRLNTIQMPENVHFTPEGSKALGERVTINIRRAREAGAAE